MSQSWASQAVEAWLSEHPMTADDARAYLDTPFACGCAGGPFDAEFAVRMPCSCQLNGMAACRALGETVEPWVPPVTVDPGWPKGKPRPVP